MFHREINISDLHVPYFDPFAWQLTLNIVSEVKPTKINILGDALDFYQLSTFDKDPEQIKNGGLQENLDQWFQMARELQRAAPDTCEYTFVPGNHEDRLRRYLMRNPELHGLEALKLPSLMRLDQLGIQYFENEVEIIAGLLLGKHGNMVRKDSAMSARAELEREKYTISVISGHTHRKGTHYVTTRLRTVKAVENGCLCRLDPEYMTGIPNWQQGITLTTHWGGELFDVADILYLNTGERIKAVVDGQLVTL
jgi:UDP-2,3-diacylglucosamine pyrophosphatase LpxH